MRRVILAIVAVGCAHSSPERAHYDSRLASVTAYKVSTPFRSPAGVAYGGTLDPVMLDYQVGRVAACLKRIPEPTEAERAAMECVFHRGVSAAPGVPAVVDGLIRRDVRLELFDVLVAPDWSYVMCHREQGYSCAIGPKYCLEKGVTPTEECPCRCRATVQGGRTIVVTPNLKLFNAELTRLVTGCNSVWEGPLKECAAP